MSRASVAAWVLSVAGLSAWVGGARAQECQDDSGCAKGFRCEVTGTSGCTAPAPAPRPSCDGGACPPGGDWAPAADKPCETREYRSCVPAPCMADADCAAGMVCHGMDIGTCSAGAAAPCVNGVCPVPEPPKCTSQTVYQCVPRYQLPCEQASDCGTGFTCEAVEECACAGSAGAPTPATPATPPSGPLPMMPAELDAGTADLRAPTPPGGQQPWPADAGPAPGCTCKVSDEKYCRLVYIQCKADSDCPGDLRCAISGSTGSGGAAAACDAPPGADGGCNVLPVAPPPPAAGQCVPPGKLEGSSGVPARGGVATPTGTNPPPPGGTTSGTGNTPRPDNGGPAPVVPPSAAPTPPGAESATNHVKSCTTAGPGMAGTSGLALWASLLTLAAVLVRRRRRA